MTISFNSFAVHADSNHDLFINDSDQSPGVQIAKYTLADKILYFLSNFEIFLKLQFVSKFRNKLTQKNIETITSFQHAIKNLFENDLAKKTINQIIKEIDSSGKKPLNSRHILSAIKNLSTLYPAATQQLFPLEKSIGKICGYANLGNTCYANSALKFLLHSLGGIPLITHLEKFKAKSLDTAAVDAADAFIALILKSHYLPGSAEVSVEKELQEFFRSLQKTSSFNQTYSNGKLNFPIVGLQQDPEEFLARLSELFNLSALCESPIDNGSPARDFKAETAFWCPIIVENKPQSLQDVISANFNNHLTYLDIEKTKNFSVSIVSHQEKFSFDFNQPITLPVIDQAKNRQVTLTLAPTEVIAFQGSDNRGHYYIYNKKNNDHWTKHNDSRVSSCETIPQETRPKFINFTITQISGRTDSQLSVPATAGSH